MLAITVSDVRRFIIPDILSLPAIPAGLAVAAYLALPGEGAGLLLWHVAAMAFGALAFYAIRWGYHRYRGQEGLGLGDVKLAAVASPGVDIPTVLRNLAPVLRWAAGKHKEVAKAIF